LHYLPFIERKVGALDQAAPLRGWDLPEARHPVASLAGPYRPQEHGHHPALCASVRGSPPGLGG
jgi:hypothetical protein